MKIACISIGDELLIGQVINKNAAWIGEQCSAIGANVVAHSVIGDNAEDLISELERLGKVCDLVLLTGGLGPTHDDITKHVLAEIVNDTLIENQDWIVHLTALMKRMGRELTSRNAAQAMVPSSATVLHNEYGTAPGLQMAINNTIVIAMPGVPVEMRYLMNEHVLPLIKTTIANESDGVKLYHTLLTTGVAESTLADILGDPSSFLNSSSLAFLPNLRGVRLRIGAAGEDAEIRERELARIVDYIRNRAGQYLFGSGSDTLPQVIGSLLIQNEQTIAVAESCTGGLLGAACTDVPGSSGWFEGGVLTYSNAAKSAQLGIDPELIRRHGAVSEEVATAMSESVRAKFGTSWGVGITGVAGPGGGTEEKPVGLVWISVAGPDGTTTTRFVFGKERSMNRERSVGAALAMVWKGLR